MANPTEDIPADGPLGQSEGDFGLRTLGLGVAGAVRIRAVIEPASQLDRPQEGMKPPRPVVTDVHHPSAGRALPIEDVELPEGEVGILGPDVGHRADLPAALGSIAWSDQPRDYTCRSRDPRSVADRCFRLRSALPVCYPRREWSFRPATRTR